jgi:hypothetical protein
MNKLTVTFDPVAAGKPRQFPKGRVDTGNPSQPGDDVVYEYPGHGEKVS